MLSDDESAQAVAVQLKLLEDYYEDLAGRESILLRLYREHKSSLTSLTTLKEAKSFDLLIPIGGGAHLPVSFTGGGQVVVDIGSGVAMDKTPEEAIAYVTSRIKDIEDTLGKVTSQKREVAKRLRDFQQQLEASVASEAPKTTADEPAPPGDD